MANEPSNDDLMDLQRRILDGGSPDDTAFLPDVIIHKRRKISYDSDEGRRLVAEIFGDVDG